MIFDMIAESQNQDGEKLAMKRTRKALGMD